MPKTTWLSGVNHTQLHAVDSQAGRTTHFLCGATTTELVSTRDPKFKCLACLNIISSRSARKYRGPLDSPV